VTFSSGLSKDNDDEDDNKSDKKKIDPNKQITCKD